jgi:hypothetical protein
LRANAGAAWEVILLLAPDHNLAPDRSIVQMLMGMLRRFSERGDFLREDEEQYGIDQDQEQEPEQ